MSGASLQRVGQLAELQQWSASAAQMHGRSDGIHFDLDEAVDVTFRSEFCIDDHAARLTRIGIGKYFGTGRRSGRISDINTG